MRTYNIFISHSWTYGDAYDKLIEMLEEAPYFVHKDYSVPKNDPVHNAPTDWQLEEAIGNKIRPCSAVVIMAGKYATYSKWIQREIQIAKGDYTKPVVAIRPWANAQVSTVVKKNADRLVGWNTNSIVSAIRELVP